MAKLSALSTHSKRARATAQGSIYASIVVLALLLGGCAERMAVEIENTKAAQELARVSRPPGSVYAGWRVFQDRCSTCHGPGASGGAGPDLLPLVRQMGPRRFFGLVLKRYDWNLPPAQAGKEREAMDTWVEEAMQRKEPGITMPAWEGSPCVSAHIADLYAYLAARAEGSQGEGRPTP